MRNKTYNIFVDTGGTFTDCIAVDSIGKLYKKKVLSSGSIRGTIVKQIDRKTFKIEKSWGLRKDILKGYKFRLLKNTGFLTIVKSFNVHKKEITLEEELPNGFLTANLNFELFSGEEAPILGARLITQTGLHEKLPVNEMRLGSTKGTNALLEHKGANVTLLVTKGFKDIMKIRYQDRPDIFARNVIKQEPLFEKVIELDERITASGEILSPLDDKKLIVELKKLKQTGKSSSIAIALLNSWANPIHEEKTKQLVLEAGFKYISVSSELSSLIKYIPRAETTIVNAYLYSIIQDYLSNIKDKVTGAQFHIMNSAGGLVGINNFNPKDSLLSGPAGGIVGAVTKAKASGYKKIISFDMGGTSTDVARYNNSYDYQFDLKVGDARIFSPAFSIETVAAGGGSVCYYDGFKLCVGPESAGAFPGPACYGAGGPLSITDVNLLLGRIDIGRFGIPIFPDEAEKQIEKLLEEIRQRSGEEKRKDQILIGFLQIANEIMAGAIRKVSVSKGFDPAEHALLAFGGAGGMHAASIAELLNIKEILLPDDAGLLSAFGISQASIERFAEELVLQALDTIITRLPEQIKSLESEAIRMVKKEGLPSGEIEVKKRIIYLRKAGQDATIELEYFSSETLLQSFKEAYTALYGYWNETDSIEVESIRVIAGSANLEKSPSQKNIKIYSPLPTHHILSNVYGEWKKIPVFSRNQLKPGAKIKGFALILDDFSTWVIEKNWDFIIDANHTGVMKLANREITKPVETFSHHYEEIELELFTRRFMAIATNMGTMLQRTSVSVNVKERLDFSCSLLDNKGELVANAPHIPVHLGSLGVCVREIIKEYPMEPGDTIITNHPRYGGSHLPDITLV
ncbi:MAG: hydantoinase B/oxoprolinase family protein, partial [Bacteroidales bacterium]|nr:hydantoinase B/oxoprolinase family protein [Bacteroidales bacterium]